VQARLSPGSGGDVAYEVLTRLDLPPGSYQLRVAATGSLGAMPAPDPRVPAVALIAPDEDIRGKAGSVYCDVDVPDFAAAPLSLSGIALNLSPGLTAGPKERLASVLPIVPTTERTFRRIDQVTAFVRVYQGGTGTVAPVTLVVRVIDGRGRTVIEASDEIAADRFQSARAADSILDVPVARLAPGPHLLTLQATRGTVSTPARVVRFDVQ